MLACGCRAVDVVVDVVTVDLVYCGCKNPLDINVHHAYTHIQHWSVLGCLTILPGTVPVYPSNVADFVWTPGKLAYMWPQIHSSR